MSRSARVRVFLVLFDMATHTHSVPRVPCSVSALELERTTLEAKVRIPLAVALRDASWGAIGRRRAGSPRLGDLDRLTRVTVHGHVQHETARERKTNPRCRVDVTAASAEGLLCISVEVAEQPKRPRTHGGP